MIGRVVAVEQDRQGVTLDGDHAQGVTVLSVMEAFDLEPDGGFLSLPSGEVIEYGPVDVEDTSVPLVGELPELVEDAEHLDSYPPFAVTIAQVTLDDGDQSEPFPVTVPSGVAGWSSLAPGAALRFEVTKGGDLVATDVVSGSLEVAADQVSTGTIRSEWRMSRDGAIVIGDDDAGSGELTHDGLRFSVPGPFGPYENVVMTTGETSFGVMGEDGTRLGGISDDGNVSGVNGSFSEELTIRGESITEMLDKFPRGVIARNFKSTTGTSIVTGVERAYMRVNTTLYPGRLYRARAWMRANLSQSGGGLTLWLRWAQGSAASLSSPTLPDTVNYGFGNVSANQNIVGWAEGFFTVESETPAQFLLSYRGDYGATPSSSRAHLYVEDVGTAAGAPITGGTDDPGDTPEPTVTEYTTTWTATASRTYDKNGNAIAGKDGLVDAWFWHGTPTDYQSPAILFGGGASDSTDPGELGKTLPQALSGATITNASVLIRSKTFFSSPVNLCLSPLNSSTLPSTKRVTRFSTWFNRPWQGGDTISLGLGDTPWFTNGTNRGVCIGDYRGKGPSGEDLTSGSFHGPNDKHPPRVRITYTRED